MTTEDEIAEMPETAYSTTEDIPTEAIAAEIETVNGAPADVPTEEAIPVDESRSDS